MPGFRCEAYFESDSQKAHLERDAENWPYARLLIGDGWRPLSGPPEPGYEPGLPSVKLTPGPRGLLVAMRDGAVLHERGRRWSSWSLQRPGKDPEKITERRLNALRLNAFIARNGMLPTEPDSWYQFDWQVTAAGCAWLVANARV